MSYFSYFPLTSVVLDKDAVDIRQARNILVRAKFSEYLKSREGLYETYQIKDGERPDTLAHKLYGRSDLHWVILLFNEILDPYYEWPMSYDELNQYIAYKYPGKAVYVDDTFFYADGVKKNQRIDATEPIVDGEVVVSITQGSETRELKAVSYDPLLMKMVVLDDGWLNNGVPENRRIVLKNSKETNLLGSIRYIEQNDTALNHFVDSSGETLNPRGRIDETADFLGVTVRILLYTNPNDDIRRPSLAVLPYKNNSEYEYELNESKRSINLLKPYFINEALKQFSFMFNKTKTSGV
jgi:hypothetical protein